MDYKKLLRKIGKVILSERAKKIEWAAIEAIVMGIAEEGTRKAVERILSHDLTLTDRLEELDKLKEKGKLTGAEYDRVREKAIELYA